MKFLGPVPFLCLAIATASAQELRITNGPKDEQVLQRNLEGWGQVSFEGTITGKKVHGKRIEVRVLNQNGVVPNLDWAPAGQVQKQAWSAELKRIPTGGPYRIELRLAGSAPFGAVENILVGDLWLLAGQSNMEGVGDLVDVQQPDPMVHSFDMADHWGVAEEPLHTLVGAEDRVHWRANAKGEYERLAGDELQRYTQQRRKGAGPGLPFAVEMFKRTGVPVGLLPCAHGGTSMEQWSPALKDQEGDSLYGSMIRRLRAAGGKVKGVLWYQGESDANEKAAPEFEKKFIGFVQALRSDAGQPDLPFYYVQIGRHVSNVNVKDWNLVQEAQRRAESLLRHSGMVTAVDLSLDDAIHVSTPDLKRLGRRLADRACHDLFPRVRNFGELKTGPRPVSAVFEDGAVKVKFTDVNERLVPEGRISGFTIHDSAGNLIPTIYKARIDPAEASTVLLYVSGKLPTGAELRYGFGKDPYCNVRDAMDMAVPAFGPLVIRQL